MSTHPYIPLYVDDFEAATAHLSVEEDGLYNRLLRLCWRTPGCSLPDDPAWIARKVRVTEEAFDRVARPILAEFFTLLRGRWVQRRLKREYDDISRKKTARKLAGKKGGEAKALNQKDKYPSNATLLPGDTRAFPNPEPEPEDKPPVAPQGGEQVSLGLEPEATAARRKAKRTIPEGYPDEAAIAEQQAKARSSGKNLDLAYQAERFRNWAIGKDARYADWAATWRNWAGKAITEAPATPFAAPALMARPESLDDVWGRRVRTYQRNAYWNRLEWGPEPGKPGCQVSPDIQREFNTDPAKPQPIGRTAA